MLLTYGPRPTPPSASRGCRKPRFSAHKERVQGTRADRGVCRQIMQNCEFGKTKCTGQDRRPPCMFVLVRGWRSH
jgi:hypothetical protein